MAGGFWRMMSTQHLPDEVQRMVRTSTEASSRRIRIRAYADGQTLVEALAFDAADAHRAAWRDLAQRAIEPNPFLDPDFALSAALHLPQGQRPEFVAVWQGVGFEPRARLIGLWALEGRASSLFGGPVRGWRYKHSALGVPLIDFLAADRAVDAMLGWLSRNAAGRRTLSLSNLIEASPIFELIARRCAERGLRWTVIERSSRAVLRSGRNQREAIACVRSTKHRRETERQMRRLCELGAVERHSATGPAEVRAAIEWFLALESKGWKGRRGTALLSDVGDAAFLRSSMRMLAAAGKCRIDWIALDGRPIAMALLLYSGDRAYFWKTAYDEEFARFSPGVQMAFALLRRQLDDPSVQLTDSCAIADHPMIDRVWPDRQEMADVMISLDPTAANAFPFAAGRERLRVRLRARLKTAAAPALRFLR